MADAIRKLAKSIVGERKPRNPSAIGTIKGFRNGSAIVLLDNAVATVSCALNVDAAIGDRVTVDVRDHTATVTANHSVKSGADVEQRLAALEQTTDDLEGQQDVDREAAEESSGAEDVPTINGSRAYRFENDRFQLQIPGSATAIHGEPDRMELAARSIDFSANNITGLGAGFAIHTDQYSIGAINSGAYGDHTFDIPIDGQIVGVPNAYCDSKAIAVLGHRVDFDANTVRIDYRNVGDSKNTANLGIIHIAVVVAV